MGSDTLLTIDRLSDDNVALKGDLVELSLPSSLFTDRINVGDKIVLSVSSEVEFNQNKAKLAKDVLQELIKEE